MKQTVASSYLEIFEEFLDEEIIGCWSKCPINMPFSVTNQIQEYDERGNEMCNRHFNCYRLQ